MAQKYTIGDAPPQSKYTIGDAPPPAAGATPQEPSMLSKGLQMAGDVYTGATQGLEHTLGGLGNLITRPFVSPEFAQRQKSYLAATTTPQTTPQKIGYGVEQAGEFLAPGGAEERIASFAPKIVRPLARIGMSALSSGAINKAQGGDFGAGALAGAGGSAIGQGLKAAAPALAETALKVRGNQRLFGRTVGDAILNDTRGVRPETIGRTAQETISKLTPQLDAADQASAAAGLRGSLKPARTAVSGIISGHQANRAMKTAEEIQPVAGFLKTDQLTGLPLAEQQAAPGLRSIKRGLTSDFIGKWKPDESIEQKQAARAAYGRLNEELHAASPGTKELDQRISSLIPVKQQGERVASGAPITQRVLGRLGAHTGALTLGGIGAAGGYKERGVPGAIVGGLTGVVAPELLASPEAQMAAARTLYKANALRPAVGGLLQTTRRPKSTEGKEP